MTYDEFITYATNKQISRNAEIAQLQQDIIDATAAMDAAIEAGDNDAYTAAEQKKNYSEKRLPVAIRCRDYSDKEEISAQAIEVAQSMNSEKTSSVNASLAGLNEAYKTINTIVAAVEAVEGEYNTKLRNVNKYAMDAAHIVIDRMQEQLFWGVWQKLKNLSQNEQEPLDRESH